MASKENIHIVKAYKDFMRYKGVPKSVHRDLVPEQKVDKITDETHLKALADEAGPDATQYPERCKCTRFGCGDTFNIKA